MIDISSLYKDKEMSSTLIEIDNNVASSPRNSLKECFVCVSSIIINNIKICNYCNFECCVNCLKIYINSQQKVEKNCMNCNEKTQQIYWNYNRILLWKSKKALCNLL